VTGYTCRSVHVSGKIRGVESAVEKVAAVMRGVDIWWAVAGGWAIDLWLGEQTREHHDVEVVVRRVDQAAVWDALHNGWDLSCIDPPQSGWSPWRRTRRIELPSFQLKARGPALEFDLFLESTSDGNWIFRRDQRVQRSIDGLTTTRFGVPILVPAVQLLYMAKSEEPKNQHDFEVARPALDDASAEWLRRSLAVAHPGHRWLAQL
jgi:hypothetical protein